MSARRTSSACSDAVRATYAAFLALLENVLDTAQGSAILLLATSRHDLLERQPEWTERRGYRH